MLEVRSAHDPYFEAYKLSNGQMHFGSSSTDYFMWCIGTFIGFLIFSFFTIRSCFRLQKKETGRLAELRQDRYRMEARREYYQEEKIKL